MTENQEIIGNDDIPIFACTNDQLNIIHDSTEHNTNINHQATPVVPTLANRTGHHNSNNNQAKNIVQQQQQPTPQHKNGQDHIKVTHQSNNTVQPTPQIKNEPKTVPSTTNNQSKNSGSGIVYEFKNSNVTFGSSNQINEDNKIETRADSKTPVSDQLVQDNNNEPVITDEHDKNRSNKQVDTDIGIFQCDNTSISSTSTIEKDITNTIDGLFDCTKDVGVFDCGLNEAIDGLFDCENDTKDVGVFDCGLNEAIDGLFDCTKDVGVFDCGTVTPSTVNAQSKFFVCDNNSSNTNVGTKTNVMKTKENGLFDCENDTKDVGVFDCGLNEAIDGLFNCENDTKDVGVFDCGLNEAIDGLFDCENDTKDVGVFDCGTVTPSTDNAQSKFFVCDNNSSNTNITNEMKTNEMKTNEIGIFECDGTSAEKRFRENGEETKKMKVVAAKLDDITNDVVKEKYKEEIDKINKNLDDVVKNINNIDMTNNPLKKN